MQESKMKRTQIFGLMFLAACLPFRTARPQTPASLQTQINELRLEIRTLVCRPLKT
jgi:hypothetical protein